jgi:hypothetical protein
MLAQTSHEIQAGYRAAALRRRRAARLARPYLYCDHLIRLLEEMHMQGKKFVPKAFRPQLYRVLDLLPDGVTPPPSFRSLIRDVLDDLFDLQEQLLGHRQPERNLIVALETAEEISRAS